MKIFDEEDSLAWVDALRWIVFVGGLFALIVILATVLVGCQSAPVIVQSDTRAEQQAARDTAKDLEAVRKANPTMPAQDQAVVIVAEKQLTGCAIIEEQKDKEINQVNEALTKCQAALMHSEGSGGSWWTRMKRAFAEYGHVLAFSVGSFIVGTFFGRTLLDMTWAALKVALHLS